MATELLKSSVTGTWVDVAGAAASQTGVQWQNIGGIPIALSFSTLAPSDGDPYIMLGPSAIFQDNPGSVHVWAKSFGGTSAICATLNPGGVTDAQLRAAPIQVSVYSGAYTLASNITLASGSTSTPVASIIGGSYIFAYILGGTTPSLVLESLGPDGVTYQTVSTVSASGAMGVVLGSGATVRLRNAGANSITGLSGNLS